MRTETNEVFMKQQKVLIIVAAVVAIAAIVIAVIFFTGGGNSIVGTWETPDGTSITFTKDGKMRSDDSALGMGLSDMIDVTYSVRNGKLFVTMPLVGEQELGNVKVSGNKLTLTVGGESGVLTRRR